MKSPPYFLLLFLLAAGLEVFAQGILVIDQQATLSIPSSAGLQVVQSNSPMGQSFTPTMNRIEYIQLNATDKNPDNGLGATLTVNIRAGSITGAVLGSTMPVVLPDKSASPPFYTLATFYFATPIALTPGTNYFFDITVSPGSDLWYTQIYHYGYPGGTAYRSGQPLSEPFDMWFREGIVVYPVLTVSNSDSSVSVSWPAALPGYVLEQNTDLSTTNWNTSSYSVTTNGETKSITISPPAGNLFFRLKQ